MPYTDMTWSKSTRTGRKQGGLLLAAGLCLTAGGVVEAQVPPAPPGGGAVKRVRPEKEPGTPLYDGDLSKAMVPIKLGSFGNGKCEEVTKSFHYDGEKVLEIETRGLYEGGRIEFPEPLDIGPYMKDGYLILKLRLGTTSEASGRQGGPTGQPGEAGPEGGGAIGQPGEQGALGGLGAPITGPPAGGGARGEAGMQPAGAPAGGQEKEEREIKNLRLLFLREKGITGLDRFGLPDLEELTDEEGWVTLPVPFSRFTSTPNASGGVKHLTFCGDVEARFWIGQIKLDVDPAPFQLVLLAADGRTEDFQIPLSVASEGMEFWVEEEHGWSLPKITWDFDDSNGIQEDDLGKKVSHAYAKAGKYKVSVTITDRMGHKEPLTKTITVDVQGK